MEKKQAVKSDPVHPRMKSRTLRPEGAAVAEQSSSSSSLHGQIRKGRKALLVKPE